MLSGLSPWLQVYIRARQASRSDFASLAVSGVEMQRMIRDKKEQTQSEASEAFVGKMLELQRLGDHASIRDIDPLEGRRTSTLLALSCNRCHSRRLLKRSAQRHLPQMWRYINVHAAHTVKHAGIVLCRGQVEVSQRH